MTETTDLAHRDPDQLPAAPAAADFAQMLDRMLQLATNEKVDAAKFETFRKAANEQQDRAERREYYQDKAAALFEMPSIRKDSRIVIEGKNGAPDRVQGTFAKWSDMQRAIYPILDKHNLRLTHKVGHEGTVVLVTPVLQHRNGFVEEGDQMALPLDTSGGKNNTQGAGSAQQYGMRYTTVAMLGIRYEAGDDDGNLLALPDEPLNDQQQRRVAEAEAAWKLGEEAFDEWWAKVQPMDRAWMIQTNRYTEITGRPGLPGALPPPRREEPEPEPKAEPEKKPNPPVSNEPGGPDVSTPQGWTEQYETDCRKAETVVDLTRIQTRGAKAIQKLAEDPNLSDLYDRVLAAGKAADERLRRKAD